MGLFNLKCTQYCKDCLPNARLLWYVMFITVALSFVLGLMWG